MDLQLFSLQAVDVGAAAAPTATIARLINVDNMVRSRMQERWSRERSG